MSAVGKPKQNSTSTNTVRILGIDPGSRITGYGCVEWSGFKKLNWIDDGILKLSSTSGPATIPLEKRLLDLFNGLDALIRKLNPDVLVIERIFFAKNAVSALKLGQARGVALLVGALRDLAVVEFSPTQVKLAIVGAGRADKNQVAKMVRYHLGFDSPDLESTSGRETEISKRKKKEFLTADASDALALAIAFAHGLPSQGLANWKVGSHANADLKAPKRNLRLSDALAHRIPFDLRRKN